MDSKFFPEIPVVHFQLLRNLPECTRYFLGHGDGGSAEDIQNPTQRHNFSFPHILAAATPRNGGTRSAFDAPPRNGSSVSDRIFTFIGAKVATGRPNQSKQMTADEMELDGVEKMSLELPDFQPDALEQGSEHNNDLKSLLVPHPHLKSLLVPASAPSPIPPPHSKPPKPPLSTRRFSRKRGAFKAHEDVPVQKTKKTEAAVAPEPSDSEKKTFWEEHRALYGDTEPA
ncbi:hypothetical protein DFH08DRAFT_820778 [Mycena albidolilacea]|uniref:Uncharacterized protein n=1 Tax=Mycena albidolilacea TaxID=1033008 RepID=A0AAD6ZBB6_9AGAR|nr:hypothetical protein DFH08DRAFT_820778 [Mycena albidolilacea]